MARSPSTDQRWVIPGFLSGDPATVALVDSWIDIVLHAEFRSLQSDWEDLRQEVRIRLLNCLRANRFNGDSALSTFVHRVTRNVGIDSTRKAYRHREETVGGSDVEIAARSAEDPGARLVAQDLLSRILERLSDRDRAVVDLVFVQHLSYAEAARRLEISDGAFRVLMFRCKNRLLKTMRRLEGRKERPC